MVSLFFWWMTARERKQYLLVLLYELYSLSQVAQILGAALLKFGFDLPFNLLA